VSGKRSDFNRVRTRGISVCLTVKKILLAVKKSLLFRSGKSFFHVRQGTTGDTTIAFQVCAPLSVFGRHRAAHFQNGADHCASMFGKRTTWAGRIRAVTPGISLLPRFGVGPMPEKKPKGLPTSFWRGGKTHRTGSGCTARAFGMICSFYRMDWIAVRGSSSKAS